MIMALFDSLIDGLGNLVGWVLISAMGTAAAMVSWVLRQTVRNKRAIDDLEDETEIREDPTRLESHEHRMERQQSDIADLKGYFTGDENDPNNPGLLTEIHDIKENLQDDE